MDLPEVLQLLTTFPITADTLKVFKEAKPDGNDLLGFLQEASRERVNQRLYQLAQLYKQNIAENIFQKVMSDIQHDGAVMLVELLLDELQMNNPPMYKRFQERYKR